jgi:cellulose synthase/poly-beta-1,6-N-acetylglucosamine synthase-like glycosyltransferase
MDSGLLRVAAVALAAFAVVLWAAGVGVALWTRRCVRRLSAQDGSRATCLPRVSLIVPACDEVDTLEATVRSRLAVDYPDLEVNRAGIRVRFP